MIEIQGKRGVIRIVDPDISPEEDAKAMEMLYRGLVEILINQQTRKHQANKGTETGAGSQ